MFMRLAKNATKDGKKLGNRMPLQKNKKDVLTGLTGRKDFIMITNKETGEIIFKNTEIRLCPRCGKEYDDYPAVSRVDDETEICPECGFREAIEAARLYYSK